MVARSHMYTYAANVWALSIFSRTLFCRRRTRLTLRFAACFIDVRHATTQVATAVNRAGLGGVSVPILFPGAVRPLALAPHISDEDRAVIANTTKLVNFLSGRCVRVMPCSERVGDALQRACG
jgi:hypothetical protein